MPRRRGLIVAPEPDLIRSNFIGRRQLLVLAVLLAESAFAKPWRGIDPGVTTRAEILSAFGSPLQTTPLGSQEQLTYEGTHAIQGMRQVQFSVDSETAVVQRIDLFPVKLSKQGAVKLFGRPCPKGARPGQPGCYIRRVTKDGRAYLLYAEERLAVFLHADDKRVVRLAYLAPRGKTPKGPQAPLENAPAEPQGTVAAPPTEEAPPPSATTAETDASSTGDSESSTSDSTEEIKTTIADDEESAQTLQLNKESLKIGGQFYLRTFFGVFRDGAAGARTPGYTFSAPFLLDAYIDGRPNDRVRAMVRPRFLYSVPGAVGVDSNGTLDASTSGVQVGLDQLWLSFDIARLVFVTVGRQHVKWGVSRLWNPTDFLGGGQKNLLTMFDDRLGSDLLKLQIPWEEADTNFYVIGVLDRFGPATQPLRPGIALRAEVVLGTAEIGAGAVFQSQLRPRYSLDASVGVGPLDVHAELSLRYDTDRVLWRRVAAPDLALGYAGQFEAYKPSGPLGAASGGVSWPIRLNEASAVLLGVEAFYQSIGYADRTLLPWLVIQNDYQPLYFAKAYGALFASYSLEPLARTVTLTVIPNLTDGSAVARIDASAQVYNAMTVELFLQLPFGTLGGELRPDVEVPALSLGGGQTSEPVRRPLPLFELGIAFRINV